MNKFRILERDGEYKVQKLVGYCEPEWVFETKTKGLLWWKEVDNIAEVVQQGKPGTWETALFFNCGGDVTTTSQGLCRPIEHGGGYSPDIYVYGNLDPAIFSSKEHAIEWIEHFWGQQYTLEEGDWRVV